MSRDHIDTDLMNAAFDHDVEPSADRVIRGRADDDTSAEIDHELRAKTLVFALLAAASILAAIARVIWSHL